MDNMKKCAACGMECAAQMKFCPECGQKFPEKKRPENCLGCGAPLSPTVKFCPECGRKVEDIPVAPVAPAAPVAPVEPVVPVVPVVPVAPVAPAVPTAPVAPVEPVAPAAPVAPVEPVAPVVPVEPVAAVEPAVPAAPVEPTEPVAPAVPTAPVAPVAPVAPAAPTAPAAPVAEEPRKPMRYRCEKCGEILIKPAARCPMCGGVMRVVGGVAPQEKPVTPPMDFKSRVAEIWGNLKQCPRIIAVAVCVVIALIGGIVAAIVLNSVPSADKFVSEFEKAGYQMVFSNNGVNEFQEYYRNIRGVQSVATYSGRGNLRISDKLMDCTLEFAYIECDSAETANMVLDSFVWDNMPDDAKIVYNETNRERVEDAYTGDYVRSDGYYVENTIVSRKENVVIILWANADYSQPLSQSVAYELPAVKVIENLGF